MNIPAALVTQTVLYWRRISPARVDPVYFETAPGWEGRLLARKNGQLFSILVLLEGPIGEAPPPCIVLVVELDGTSHRVELQRAPDDWGNAMHLGGFDG